MTQQRVSPVVITSLLPATITMTVQGALGQSADLQQWQTSTGTVVAKISQNGTFTVAQNIGIGATYFVSVANNGPYIETSASAMYLRNRVATNTIVVTGAASQTARLFEIQDSASNVLAYIPPASSSDSFTSNVGAHINTGRGNYFGVVMFVNPTQPAHIGAVIRGAASQTASLQEWQSSAGTVLAKVDSAGFFNIGSSTAPKSVLQVTQTASAPGTPTLGTASGGFYLANTGGAYGLIFGVVGTGNTWIQSQRTDATATAYHILLQPVGGNVGIGSISGSPIAKLHIQNDIASTTALLVRGFTSQTADIFQIQNIAGTLLTAITAAGTINFQTGNTASTATIGAITAPVMVAGYITMQVAGTTVKVPYYNN